MEKEATVIASVHRRAGRGLISLCAAASFAGLLPAVADAGAYDVKVCKDGYGNNALSVEPDPAYAGWNLFRATNNCDGGWNGWNAISISITNGPDNPTNDPYVAQNASANIVARAPYGAGLRKIHVDNGRMADYYGNTTGWNARVMLPDNGWCRTDGEGGGWCGMGWQNPADNSGQTQWAAPDYPGYANRDIGPITGDVSSIAIGVVCNGGSTWSARPCYRAAYKPAAGVAIVSADIQTIDNTPPTISGLSGSITDGQWHKPGQIGYGVTAWDNTGIRAFTKYVDGNDAGGQVNEQCDYSQMRPCQDRQIADNTDSVNVTGYDGFHTVTLRGWAATNYWLDCAVDCADTSTTVAIDGTAPAGPASANAGPAWSNSNAFNLTAPLPASENDPDGGGPQARAPITRRIVAVCPSGVTDPNDARCKVTDANPVPGQSPASAAVSVPSEGAWTAQVRLVDAAGNVGGYGARVPVNYDLSAPSLAVNQTRGGVAITATDALAGPASVTYRVDGKGDWVTTTGTVVRNILTANVTAPAGQHYVEVKGTDKAGNVSSAAQRFDVTVPDNDQNVEDLNPFKDGSQLAVVDRGAINGLGGGEGAKLTAAFVRSAKSKNPKPLTVRTIAQNGTATIQGQLVDAGGRGISNARVDLGVSIAGGVTSVQKAAAQTDEAGRFSIALGKGLTSRGLTVAYMARVNDAQPAATAGVALVVKAKATFKAHRPHVGRSWFSGTVSKGYLTKQGVEVKLQWRTGHGFKTFTTTRTDISGKWRTSWHFSRHGERYVMRALVTSSPAYAYKGAASSARLVRVK